MSDSSIVIIQGTMGLYTVATRCHRCFAVTLKYTEDSSLKILPHSLILERHNCTEMADLVRSTFEHHMEQLAMEMFMFSCK